MIVHLVTDRRRLSATGSPMEIRGCLLQQARYAVDAGVDVLQIRERDLEAGDLVEITKAIVEVSRGSRTRVVVNDRVDVALAAGAAGVHLPGHGLRPFEVRQIVPAKFIVGCSVHSPAEAREARGADYLIAGTVWPSQSKVPGHPCLGIAGLAAVVHAATVPVLAIGGLTASRAGAASAVGAAGIAAIGLFLGTSPDDACRAVPLTASIETLRSRFDTARSGS